MSIEVTRKHVAEIICRIVDGGFEGAEAYRIIEQYPDVDNAKLRELKDRSVDEALHTLGHYLTDEDIRRKDITYAEMQADDLKSMAHRLAEGKPITGGT